MERGVSCVIMSTFPISSKKLLQLLAYFYTLLERYPDVAVDSLMRASMIQLRKTTNVFIEWGSFNICGTLASQKNELVLEKDWKWPRIEKPTKK